jgi:hypothetical protein
MKCCENGPRSSSSFQRLASLVYHHPASLIVEEWRVFVTFLKAGTIKVSNVVTYS